MKPTVHFEWQPLFALGMDYPSKVLKQIKPKIVFDIGANEGGYVDTWLSFGAKTVHCFEPVPDMAEKCSERFKTNPNVFVHKLGVSDGTHKSENLNVFNAWSLAPNNSRPDAAIEYKNKPPFSVHFIAVDDFGIDPDFIKLDVDGYEFKALRGMKRILTTIRPPIYFEFSLLPNSILNENIQSMCDYIYSMGYVACSMDGWKCPDPKEMMKYYPHNSSYDIFLMPKESNL